MRHPEITMLSGHDVHLKLGLAKDKCETLQEGETSVFLCENETFCLLQLGDRDFSVLNASSRRLVSRTEIGTSRLSRLNLSRNSRPQDA